MMMKYQLIRNLTSYCYIIQGKITNESEGKPIGNNKNEGK